MEKLSSQGVGSGLISQQKREALMEDFDALGDQDDMFHYIIHH